MIFKDYMLCWIYRRNFFFFSRHKSKVWLLHPWEHTHHEEHNDKYIYKSVAFLVQCISKDIRSLQQPLSNQETRLFQLVILIMRIIVVIKRFFPKPLKVHGHLNNREIPPPTTPPWCCYSADFSLFVRALTSASARNIYIHPCAISWSSRK